jgi:hypothetical protein
MQEVLPFRVNLIMTSMIVRRTRLVLYSEDALVMDVYLVLLCGYFY